jgi:hypothetical protein
MKEIGLSRVEGVMKISITENFALPPSCLRCPLLRERCTIGGRVFECGIDSFRDIVLSVFKTLRMNQIRHQDCKIDYKLRIAGSPEAQKETALADLL